MTDRRASAGRLGAIVPTPEDFDRITADALPFLLDHAIAQTRRCLRETGQWADDIGHEKLAVRIAYELLERFLVYGRTELPCRPLFLLESVISKHFSQSEPLYYQKDLLSPLGRFLDGLVSKAVVSRDALMALYYHLYGLTQGPIVKLLGLGPSECHRVYKNFERWRRCGWERAIAEIGITEEELRQLECSQALDPARINVEATRLVPMIQAHYRRSEPQHFPCLTRQQWEHLLTQGSGYDYRVWHLAMCRDCLWHAYTIRLARQIDQPSPPIAVHFHPMPKVRLVASALSLGGNGNEKQLPTECLSRSSA